MRVFHSKYPLKEEKMKSPERELYEKRKTALQEQIINLAAEYETVEGSYRVQSFSSILSVAGMALALPACLWFSGRCADLPTRDNEHNKKRDRIERQLHKKHKALEELKKNKPEAIHFSLALK